MEFITYRVVSEPNQLEQSCPAPVFPPQRGKEWYRTEGFKEIAFIQGTTEQSYRKTSALINRIRYQPEATSARTLQDNSEREGERILEQFNTQSQQILSEHKFSSEGFPQEPCLYQKQSPQLLEEAVVHPALEICYQDLLKQELKIAVAPETLLTQMKSNPVGYENPAKTVNLSVDDVGVKHQKEQRLSEATAEVSPLEPERKYAHQTVIHIQQKQSCYVLNGVGWAKVFSVLIAFLLHNDLLIYNLMFFVDGQRTLHAFIQKTLAWFLPLQLLLDWYHLEEKCKQQLSMALQGRQIRNEVVEGLMPLLWYGLLDCAIAYLSKLEPQKIKNQEKLQQLLDYFERNRPFIPCYAVRKRLGLRNSSNTGKKYNDLLVSQRQKHNGMSWSKAGSVALAAIEALCWNKECQKWFRTGELNFKFAV